MEKLRNETVAHLSNLLASKDPLAFQQLQVAMPVAESTDTSPYLSGDEIELARLESEANAQDAMWASKMSDLE